jgi:DNA-binding transcriptional LysR family regulator
MDSDLLRTFLTVARQGSITAAAASLGYTQSAVSRQVGSLEAETGATLFARRARGVELTGHGRALLPYAEAVLRLVEEGLAELRALDRIEAGSLRLGAFPTANAALMPRAIAAFSHAHPKVTVTLREGTSNRQLSHLGLGDIDLAVISAFPAQPLDTERFDLTHLLDDGMLVALPSGHQLARRRSVRLEDLAGERWIAADIRDDDRLLSPVHLLPSPEPDVAFVVREWTAKLGLVAAGLGITLVPSLAAGTARPDVHLVPLALHARQRRRVYAATSLSRPPSPAVTRFLALLRTEASSLHVGCRRRGC